MGVSNRALMRRLRAWSVGGPVARGSTIQTSVADDDKLFLLAFVRMGGESRPWAVAWKKAGGTLKVRSVGEPRAREFVDEILVELAEDLAAHFGHPGFSRKKIVEPDKHHQVKMGELPQVWVPNSSHIDMLHFLAYAYSRRKGDDEIDVMLRLLGRMSMHLFLESRRPGQQSIIDATAALRSAFDFPCEDSRQAHLGLLIAWLENRENRDHGIQAALDAERESMAISMNPALERDVLSGLVEKYNATRKDRGKGDKKIEKQIDAVLRGELTRRISLVEKAIIYISEDQRDWNEGLDELTHHTALELYWGFLNPERRGIESGKEPLGANPETDWDARGASSRYYKMSAAQQREINALIHHDRELEAEAINDGSAFRGVIVNVEDNREGKAKKTVWRVLDSTPGALSLRLWDKVCIVGAAKRQAVIKEITPHDDGGLELAIEITHGKNGLKKANGDPVEWPHRMAAEDPSWLGIAVTLVSTSFADLDERKSMKARSRDTAPGNWMIDQVSRAPREVEDEQ